MSIQKKFTTAQALALVNQSEGNIVRDNKCRLAGHDEPGAHSLGRHLVSAGKIGGKPSGPQAGVEFVKNRFKSSPDLISSAWYKKGDMAIRLAEALNSPIGQEALTAMEDQGLSRIVIHYINQNNMKAVRGGENLFNPSHMSVSYNVTPDSETLVKRDIYNNKTEPPTFIKTISQTRKVKGFTTPMVDEKEVVGIHFVLDRYSSDRLHLQTLFPSFELDSNQFEYCVGEVTWTVTQKGSSFKKTFKAR